MKHKWRQFKAEEVRGEVCMECITCGNRYTKREVYTIDKRGSPCNHQNVRRAPDDGISRANLLRELREMAKYLDEEDGPEVPRKNMNTKVYKVGVPAPPNLVDRDCNAINPFAKRAKKSMNHGDVGKATSAKIPKVTKLVRKSKYD